ncbi:MAG: glutamate-1-semialdehyde 2,1-aminomutase [Myxococcota bacterium]|jgi:glutamate-1-semialdehyde 2,1-aminomutase|nr:glutamate-1-semialdehyde 2,1-aminomutase [Myxococcota bacterium]
MSVTGPRSQEAFRQAQEVIPGGVNSPVRAFRSVGGEPLFIRQGRGSRLVDLDGREYLDYVLSWGPLAVGHAHPRVVAAIQQAATLGTSFGAPTEQETLLARAVRQLVPSLELVRFVNSGTEATMATLRLARAATGREVIVKFSGNYHGHSDALLVKAGSGGATLGVPDSLGVPATVAATTWTLPYNDLPALRALFAAQGERIAAVIVEPVAANMGLVLPVPGFLEELRRLTAAAGALLIFDEVLTGFRVALGGAQARYGITPDLTALGKVIGGGLPVGAYGGRADLMAQIAPLGGVYQAGTLSGNPLAMAAGLTTLEVLQEPGAYEHAVRLTERLVAGLAELAASSGVAYRPASVGTLWGGFFSTVPVDSFETALQCDRARFTRFFWGMLERGIYLAPSPFEAGFVSTVHQDDEVAQTLAAAREVFAGLG